MYMKLCFTTCCCLLFLVSFTKAQSKDLDITKFGGQPEGDITEALNNAWKEACDSDSPSKITIPSGTFKMGAVDLKGPCKAPSINVQVDGTINAPEDLVNG
ncbi:hypothetical protein MLE29_10785, partial [Pasteurella multocida]|uniref:hypothetical protein n=1 Tax=Pasteurella multocida TaxID=747 RepID=UPI001F0DA1A1